MRVITAWRLNMNERTQAKLAKNPHYKIVGWRKHEEESDNFSEDDENVKAIGNVPVHDPTFETHAKKPKKIKQIAKSKKGW